MKKKRIADGYYETEIRRKWFADSCACTDVDDLTFTSRDSKNRICWWDITPPNTDYCHAHEVLGRAYAFEFLDLIHHPDKKLRKEVGELTLSYIVSEIIRKHERVPDLVYEGFFNVISEFLITGKVDR